MIIIIKRKYLKRTSGVVKRAINNHHLVLADALGISVDKLIEYGEIDKIRRAEEERLKSLREVA